MANDIEVVTFNLPEFLLFDILLRVPVKTLIRFRRVCKTWHALIKSPDFARTHTKMQPSLELDPTYSNVLVDAKRAGDTKRSCRLLRFNEASPRPFDFELPYLSNMEYFEVVGVCNGLFCVSLYPDGHELMICNPTTGHFRRISPSFKYLKAESRDLIFLGFGFDGTGYEVIRVITSNVGYCNTVIRAELYTMSTDTCRVLEEVREGWKSHGSSELDFREQYEAVVLDGIFYWTAFGFYGHPYIFSFDIREEEWGILSATWGTSYNDQDWQVVAFKGKLAMAFYHYKSMELYVLNEDVDWTLIHGNDFSVIPMCLADWSGEINVIGSTINGELIMSYQTEGNLKLLSYDIINDQVMVKCLRNVDVQGKFNKIYLYIASLSLVN